MIGLPVWGGAPGSLIRLCPPPALIRFRRFRVHTALSLPDIGKTFAEGLPIDFPHGHKQGGNDRADNKTENPEKRNPAESAKKYEQLMHLRIAANKNRSDDVVALTDNNAAKQKQPHCLGVMT